MNKLKSLVLLAALAVFSLVTPSAKAVTAPPQVMMTMAPGIAADANLAVFVGLAPMIAQVPAPADVAPADAVPVTGNTAADNLITAITPLILIGVVWLLKKFAPALPGWAIPIMTPLLSVGLEYLRVLTTAHESNFWLAVALGSAAVGLHQIKAQLKPLVSAPPSPT